MNTARAFDLVYNAVQQSVSVTFDAISDSRPGEKVTFRLNGPYCEIHRSPKEHIILKMKNHMVYQVLRRAREVRVTEMGGGRVLWNYPIEWSDKPSRSANISE